MGSLVANVGSKRNREEHSTCSSSSSCGDKKQQSPVDFTKEMNPREQKLLVDVLKAKALPLIREMSWKSITVWKTVCEEYNTRAALKGFQLHEWVPLVKLAKALDYCNCRHDREPCTCLIPEFPDIDGHGECSSQVSLGYVPSLSRSGNINDSRKELIANELERLRKEKRFRPVSMFESALDAWNKEVDANEVVRVSAFLNSSDDTQRMKMTRNVIQKHL